MTCSTNAVIATSTLCPTHATDSEIKEGCVTVVGSWR
jgi:hypothetical protein